MQLFSPSSEVDVMMSSSTRSLGTSVQYGPSGLRVHLAKQEITLMMGLI